MRNMSYGNDNEQCIVRIRLRAQKTIDNACASRGRAFIAARLQTHNQNMTVAARAMADKKTLGGTVKLMHLIL